MRSLGLINKSRERSRSVDGPAGKSISIFVVKKLFDYPNGGQEKREAPCWEAPFIKKPSRKRGHGDSYPSIP